LISLPGLTAREGILHLMVEKENSFHVSLRGAFFPALAGWARVRRSNLTPGFSREFAQNRGLLRKKRY